MRSILVVVHAGAGVGGLLAGLPVLAPAIAAHRRWEWVRWVYAALVAVLLGSMVALVAVDWPDLEAGARGAFGGLIGLGAVIAVRLALAHRLARSRPPGWPSRYVDHVSFTYISLWVGFLVVPALNTPAPQVAVPAVVLATVGAGHLLVVRGKRRLTDGDQPGGLANSSSAMPSGSLNTSTEP